MLPRILGILCPITRFVIGVFEGMTRVGVDHDLHFLPQLLQALLEFLYVIDRNAAVLTAKDS